MEMLVYCFDGSVTNGRKELEGDSMVSKLTDFFYINKRRDHGLVAYHFVKFSRNTLRMGMRYANKRGVMDRMSLYLSI